MLLADYWPSYRTLKPVYLLTYANLGSVLSIITRSGPWSQPNPLSATRTPVTQGVRLKALVTSISVSNDCLFHRRTREANQKYRFINTFIYSHCINGEYTFYSFDVIWHENIISTFCGSSICCFVQWPQTGTSWTCWFKNNLIKILPIRWLLIWWNIFTNTWLNASVISHLNMESSEFLRIQIQ